jgi:hypothetical protein
MLISINHFTFHAYIIGNNQISYNYHIYHCIFTFTGFCHQFDVYLGKGHNPADGKGLPYHVVMNLSQGLRGKYHHLYFDSYFTSTPLALDLLRSGIYMCGTIRQNRKYFPEDLKNLPVRIQPGQYVAKQSKNFTAVVWMDNRHVSALSTNESLEQVKQMF